ncbi:hypothetical protein [Terrisporobacter mayombei]|uniref:DUF3953 domain-containing protein n=1 Tax=Terrisporobacter mayombei TaxID=1541 RepID=A0ABY9PY61_9FIRM|nr:hypothetical protein [Terrisporobacter mayombei]MCC3868491.1 hypothetical protein [Terrisporobacter mayombei]WMT80647.1 hypothetical protein TEMA_09680 [Terrisporobacter mayombei]
MKNINKIIVILAALTGLVYIFNIERDKSQFFLWLLLALNSTINCVELKKEKQNYILYVISGLIFWIVAIININHII